MTPEHWFFYISRSLPGQPGDAAEDGAQDQGDG